MYSLFKSHLTFNLIYDDSANYFIPLNNSIPHTEKNHFQKLVNFFKELQKPWNVYLNPITSEVPATKMRISGSIMTGLCVVSWDVSFKDDNHCKALSLWYFNTFTIYLCDTLYLRGPSHWENCTRNRVWRFPTNCTNEQLE